MKQQITKSEFETLDRLGVCADQLHQAIESFMGLPDLSLENIRTAQRQLCLAIEQLLAIDEWDQDKLAHVRGYVACSFRSTEELLGRLGVDVYETFVPTQGGH